MTEKRIIAHRGLPTLAPENTLANFELMPQYNVNWLETDLGITKDEQVVVLHDDYLDRTTNGSGALTATSFKDLETYSAGSWFAKSFAQAKVPTLDQLVQFLNRTKINANIELKAVIGPNANALADRLVAQFALAIDALDPGIDLIVSSFNPIMLLKLKRLRPNVKFAVLFENHTFYEDWTLIMQAVGAKIIHPQNEGLTKATVQAMKAYGYEVNVWTVDRIDRANELFNWGVDSIFTNIADQFSAIQSGAKERTEGYGHFLTTWY